MAVPGVFASDQNIVGNRPGDFAGSLLQINPTGSAPMFALTSGMQTKPATDTIVNWFEEVKLTGRQGVSSVNGDGDGVTITVDDASSFVPGVVCLVEETGEYVLLTAVAGNVLTIVRGIGGSTAVTITTAHNFFRVGVGYEEGSGMPTAVANLGDVRFNVTQIFRNAWSITGTAKAITYYTGSQVAKNRADCGFLHSEDIERALMWGIKHVGSLNGAPFRLMDGLERQATNHGATITAAGATTDWNELLTFLRNVFAVNVKGKPNERIAFTANAVIQVFNVLAHLDGTINMEMGQTDFGLEVTKLRSPFGSISLMSHPLMNENVFYHKTLYLFHPGAIRTRWLRRTNIEGYDMNGRRINGVDADQGVYTSELSAELMAAQTAGILTGITAAAAQT